MLESQGRGQTTEFPVPRTLASWLQALKWEGLRWCTAGFSLNPGSLWDRCDSWLWLWLWHWPEEFKAPAISLTRLLWKLSRDEDTLQALEPWPLESNLTQSQVSGAQETKWPSNPQWCQGQWLLRACAPHTPDPSVLPVHRNTSP